MKENIVINTIVFMDDLSNGVRQARLLNKIKSLGINKAEIRREFIKHINTEIKEIREISDELGLELYYSVPDCIYQNGVLKIGVLEKYFIEANRMGINYVKFNIGDFENASMENVYEFNSLCDRYSIMPTVENDQTEMNGKLNYVLKFMEMKKKCDLNINYTFDMGNWIWQKEDPLYCANKLKEYATYIHVKDVDIINGTPQAVLLDTGILPWREILGIFEDNIPMALEYPCGPDPLTILNGELHKLDSYIN